MAATVGRAGRACRRHPQAAGLQAVGAGQAGDAAAPEVELLLLGAGVEGLLDEEPEESVPELDFDSEEDDEDDAAGAAPSLALLEERLSVL